MVFKTDPERQSQVEEIWLWNEYPERWGSDCGIDIVFKHKNGKTWAVQSKCYSPEYDISKLEIDNSVMVMTPTVQIAPLLSQTLSIHKGILLFSMIKM
jgi:predicted helicase